MDLATQKRSRGNLKNGIFSCGPPPIISRSHQQIQASGRREQNKTRALIEELVVDKEGSHARIEVLDWEVADWKARVDNIERRTYDIKGQSIRESFLRLEEEKASWEECVKRKGEPSSAKFGIHMYPEIFFWQQAAL